MRWTAAGAAWMAVAVALGAFGAHALAERLEAAGRVATWETGVRYHAWHALALVVVARLVEARRVGAFVPWAFLVGSALFSGSIYGLCLDGPAAVLGPITPLGGVLLIAGWVALAWRAWRAPAAP